ncbi:hypothetical protein V6N13_119830 [Hibiscus sabdariffa]
MLGQGGIWLRVPVTAFLATNILIFTAPFKALAEPCEANYSFFNMPLLLFVSLIGATVGGLLARQRKGELQRVNEQLCQINAALRRQAKIESYAPSLSYAPVGGRISEKEAFTEFKTALELAKSLQDPIEEKKAARGLGASLQRQGKYREAILAISDREGEDSGNTEAYGAIADCYTELGDLEKAGKFYDQYIASTIAAEQQQRTVKSPQSPQHQEHGSDNGVQVECPAGLKVTRSRRHTSFLYYFHVISRLTLFGAFLSSSYSPSPPPSSLEEEPQEYSDTPVEIRNEQSQILQKIQLTHLINKIVITMVTVRVFLNF